MTLPSLTESFFDVNNRLATMPDLFGKIILDAMRGDTSEHFNERDDGYSHPSSGFQYIAAFDDWAESEKDAIAHAKSPILDLGCGGARVGKYLREQGKEYVGIDISFGALQACKERGIHSVLLMSMNQLGFKTGYFNSVLMFGNNFGIPGSYEGIIDLLSNLHDLTSKNAVILAQSRDPKETDDPAHLRYHRLNQEQGRPTGHVRFHIRYKNEVSDWIDLLLCSPEEMKKLAAEANWKLEQTFGDRSLYVGLLKKK